MDSQEITLIVPIIPKKDCFDRVKANLQHLAELTRKEAGNICYKLHFVPASGTFVIYEKWKNQEALDIHMATAHLKGFLATEKSDLETGIAGTACQEF